MIWQWPDFEFEPAILWEIWVCAMIKCLIKNSLLLPTSVLRGLTAHWSVPDL